MPLLDFIIIGAPKCGTTAAVVNLSRHPEVQVGPAYRHPSHGREWIHFFSHDDEWARGVDWYTARFSGETPCECCGRSQAKRILGDKATDYLGLHVAHERIKEAMPAAKLIVFLRNPVDRLYSHWNHFSQAGMTPIAAFEDILLDGSPQIEWLDKTPERPTTQNWVEFGHYAQHLSHLFTLFPREQVAIEIAEIMRKDMAAGYKRLFRFLGVDPVAVDPTVFKPELTAEKKWPYKQPMAAATRLKWLEYYRPHNEALFNLLGEELPEWIEFGG
jgi:hypothetical protein